MKTIDKDVFEIKRATFADARLFYDARFSEIANTYSRIKTIPTYENHLGWYRANYLNNFFTIVSNGEKVGYVRIDDWNEISIAILPTHQHKRYATKALQIFTGQFKNLNATVYKSNKASQKLFFKFPAILVKSIEDD